MRCGTSATKPSTGSEHSDEVETVDLNERCPRRNAKPYNVSDPDLLTATDEAGFPGPADTNDRLSLSPRFGGSSIGEVFARASRR